MSASKAKKIEKMEVSQETQLRSTVEISELLRKLKSEVEKGTVKYYTPYSLAVAYSIKVSDAKKILNEAVKHGIMKIYSGGRRAPIYVPAHTKAK
ncbi:MAG: 30S ribosomal protein S25e [Desulfurococcaceae archaeon]